jgi:nucleotide-binding universal stress UspA family protein
MEVVHMQRSGTYSTAFLSLDKLTADPRLARRFPRDLAHRFHALPIAEQDGCVTVAMADPNDQAARVAVETALGLSSFLVRVDPTVVDALIDAAWNPLEQDTLTMSVYTAPGPLSDEVTHYAQEIASLLQADLLQEDPTRPASSGSEQAPTADWIHEQCNLFLFDSTDHPALRRLLVEPNVRRKQDQPTVEERIPHPRAALIAQQPHWPIQRILLIISGEEAYEAVMDWTLRMARASRSAVTALAVVPPAPAMYGATSALAQTLPALLSTNSILGRRMRHTARLMVEWEIEGTLRLRQGPPDWQIRRELAERQHDLVMLGTKPRRQWLRWLEGDPLSSLLRCARQPVLIALPPSG